jgi:uncharacterized repeat protein (TIGR01451 family)
MLRINARTSCLAFFFVTGLPAQDAITRDNFGNIPLYFEENRGQTDPRAKYIARSTALAAFITPDGWTLSLNGQPVSMHIAAANPKALFAPERPLEGVTNYYLGNRTITGLQHYSSVRAKDIRPGIDIIYHGTQSDLEYDLAIHPGANVDSLRLRFEGSRPVLADNGDIVLKTTAGEVRQHKPRVWQESKIVECRYVLLETGEVGLKLSKYDHSAELLIDPIISYSTYLSGTNSDTPAGIAVDGSGAYITGSTFSTDFPVTSGTNQGQGDVFVTKLNPSGTALVYSTFIGGSSQDTARGIAIDNAGNAYVTGATSSTNFPVTVNQFTAGTHGFVLKLGTTGNIVYSTALAGNNSDSPLAIATDASGSAYVTGSTNSSNFPVTAGSYKTTPGGGGDAFVVKLSTTGQISYATYLGGSANDFGAAIAVDAAGNAFVGGGTASVNFPSTPGAYTPAYVGNNDAFVVKLNPSGSALVYATYLGGSTADSVTGLALDAAGNCYVTGVTLSGDFPITPGAFSTAKPSPTGVNSGFVTKLNATGTSLVYSTFIGGANSDSTVGIAVDTNGAAYVAGSSQSTNFPTTPGALKTVSTNSFCCDYDMFLAKVAVDGSALSYSTLLGSSTIESATALALDGTGGGYMLGSSQSLIYPTTAGALQSTNPKASTQFSSNSIVISKIDFSVPTLCNTSVSPQSQSLPGRGGTISFNLTLSPGCPWEAVFGSQFNNSLTLNGPKSGVVSTSPIPITGTVPQNPNTGSSLTQTVRIGTATFTVNQDAGSCQDPVISPLSAAFDSSGGIRILSLTLPSQCAWAAVPGAPWLSVSNNPSGTGPASITIFAGPNSFSARSTTLTIAGKPLSITQTGSTCTATANISVSSTSSQGSDGVVSITTNSTACSWTAYSAAPWIQLNTSASTGQGSGFVPFIFAANPTAFTRTGQILIADVLLSITQDAGPAGTISNYSTSIVAGGGSSSTPNRGDGGAALAAYLNLPTGLAFDSVTNNLYIVDSNSSRIRVVTPDGNINTFAGGGSGTGENIPATSASLGSLGYVAVDSSSAVYLSDSTRVRKISQGNIATFAGGSSFGFGGDNGPATNALLSTPRGIAADSAGNVYISDNGNSRIRKVSGGTITTFAGGNSGLGDNGSAALAGLSNPIGISLDTAANLFIADTGNARIRKVAQGIIATVAGGGSNGGDGGPATSASLNNPIDVTVDPLGQIIISENSFQRIRKVSTDGTISTIANLYSLGVTADRSGDVYVSDYFSGLIRKLTPLPSFCSYSVSNPAQIPSAGGTVQVSVTTAAGCRWGVQLIPAWLTPSGASIGLGSGTVTFAASPNSGAPRSATLAIAGTPVQFTQTSSAASLSIVKSHVGNFSPAQQSATYTITVSNASSAGPTAGVVTVTDTLPAGLTPVAMTGSGWTCQIPSCTRSDVLIGGSNYPAVTMTVNVTVDATSPQINQVSVSGGGSASASTTDSTTITTPVFSLNRQTLNFATSTTGTETSAQTVAVSFTSGLGTAWTATSNQPNIVVTQGFGTGNGSFQVLGHLGPNGIVTVTAPGAAGSPRQIQVNINNPPPGNPFGNFDTPLDNTTGVAGAIPVTGWALDAVEVLKVDIWREPVGSEPAGVLINIGDAVFVVGARPDVESLNPKIPLNYRAGWGYQMLTNFLPNGNGTFKLHAIAHNKAGSSTDLGARTITVDNAHAVKPFGTLDTPGQGGTATGNAFVNFGWALAPNPNRIPVDGSTISVIIDGQAVGHPTYNQLRADIVALFPGYLNSGGAVGFFYIDTTTLTNGVHTISWNVFDNVGHGDGIGSRYFNVFNAGVVSGAEHISDRAARVTERIPRVVEIEEVGLTQIPLDAISGYELVNGERRPLPIGSSLKDGVFYWQPGPAFLGDFNLIFERTDGTQIPLKIKITKKRF